MSRVANSPVSLPSGVEVKLNGQDFSVKGTKGQMAFAIHDSVVLVQEDDAVVSAPASKKKRYASEQKVIDRRRAVCHERPVAAPNPC